MDTATIPARKLPLTAVFIGLISVTLLASGLYYLNRPAPPAVPQQNGASADAKGYLPNLQLSDVNIQATENFMNQQVVEIQGKITNKGPRKLGMVEVYCLFSGVDGKQIYRERLTIAHDLPPRETRSFRLPFDTLPDGWNQAMPHLVIARISFAS
jgi:hypothetical protein